MELDLSNMRDGETYVLGKTVLERTPQDFKKEKNEKEKSQKDTVKVQTDSLKALGEMLAKMNELRKLGLADSPQEIQEMADQLILGISTLQNKLNQTLVEQV